MYTHSLNISLCIYVTRDILLFFKLETHMHNTFIPPYIFLSIYIPIYIFSYVCVCVYTQ